MPKRYCEKDPSIGEVHEALFAHSADGVLLAGPDGAVLRANPAACRILGRSEEEIRRVGRAGLVVHAPEADAIVAERRRAGHARGEIALRRGDGSTLTAEVMSTTARLASGDAISLIQFRDVSEQRRVERALRESERILRLFVEYAPAAIAMFDTEMRYLAVSRRWVDHYRLSRSDLLGRSHYEIFPEIPERWREIHRRCLRGAVERAQEDSFPRADGSVDWVSWEIHPWRDGEGRIGGLLLLSEVVTERKRAELALRASEQRHRDLVEMSPDALVVSRGGMIGFVNRAALDLFGARRPSDLVGTPLLARFRGEGHGSLRDRILGVRDRAPAPALEERIVLLDGTFRDVEVSAAPFEDAGGPAVQVVLRDVTRRKLAGERLAEAQKLESIGRLAGGVAHDFNNLLTIMIACADELQREVGDRSANARANIEDIAAAARRASALTRQLLAFARKQVISPRPLDLNPLVRSAEALLCRVLGEDVRVEVALDPGLWTIRCDPCVVDQIILNLAVNARDAMPDGGRLRIETRNVDLADADVAHQPTLRPGPHVRLTVRDSGHGMTAEVKEHLFEPFFTTRALGKGTGLGLATVFGAVSQSGGAITVESAPGAGTEFRIFFPRVHGAAATAPEDAVTPRHGGAETILPVEDDDPVRAPTARSLRSGGGAFVEVAGGASAPISPSGSAARRRW